MKPILFLSICVFALFSCSENTTNEQSDNDGNNTNTESTALSDKNAFVLPMTIEYDPDASAFGASDNVKKLQITLIGENKLEEENIFYVESISIGEKGEKPLQVIEGLDYKTEMSEDGFLIYAIGDYNFDGNKDFWIQKGKDDESQLNSYFLMDRQQKKYVYHEGLSALHSPGFNNNEKFVSTYNYDEEKDLTVKQYYKFENGGFINFKKDVITEYKNGFKETAEYKLEPGNNPKLIKRSLHLGELSKGEEVYKQHEIEATLRMLLPDKNNITLYPLTNENNVLKVPHESCEVWKSYTINFAPEEGNTIFEDLKPEWFPIVVLQGPDDPYVYSISDIEYFEYEGVTLYLQPIDDFYSESASVNTNKDRTQEVRCYFNKTKKKVFYAPFDDQIYVPKSHFDKLQKSTKECEPYQP